MKSGLQMLRLALILLVATLTAPWAQGKSHSMVVVDSVMRQPLPGASVFDSKGKMIGISKEDGRLPYASTADYPLTIRYMGYQEKCITELSADTIFLQESITELPEVVVESKNHRLLHTLAYVREYSTLTTYSDTVFLFREKMVDYMLPTTPDMKYKGWREPRVLKSKSYYRFTDSQGLDSVSDQCNHHFSWADWVGIVPTAAITEKLVSNRVGTDTIYGKYSPTEMWRRNDDRLTLDVDVLADTTSRKWVPNLSLFFKDNIEFERFRVRFHYDNVVGDSIAPIDLAGYSFNIESNGRGRGMFRFARKDEQFFVSTYAEVYIIDKEYITIREAKKWERGKWDSDEMTIYEPQEAPELQPAIVALVDRVNNIDYTQARLSITPDQRLASRKVERNLGQKVLDRIKGILGISSIIGRHKQKKQWKEFRHEQLRRNAE